MKHDTKMFRKPALAASVGGVGDGAIPIDDPRARQ